MRFLRAVAVSRLIIALKTKLMYKEKISYNTFYYQNKRRAVIAQSVQRLDYGLDDPGSMVRFPTGTGNFSLTTVSRMALGPTQPLIQRVPGALSLRVKRPGRETDHSPTSTAEVKECVELYLDSPNTPSWRGAQINNKSIGPE
jgi:hypothetical protein